jgi:NAD-dependent deacetylase
LIAMPTAVAGLEAARPLIAASRRMLAFTGAGVSTASGIPDFRSPGGVWSRFQPVLYPDFLADHEARLRYWEMRRLIWPDFVRAEPNVTHRTLARLEACGRLLGVVTQNIDGLHEMAGSQQVVALHGTNRRAQCVACARSNDMAAVIETLTGDEVPRCTACGGWLKAATISFGQMLDPDVLRDAFDCAARCDLLLTLGSSLVVYPAAALPEAALAGGAKLVIVNREATPLDALATAVVHGELQEIVPALLGD